MYEYERIVSDTKIPKMAKVRQSFPRPVIADPPGYLAAKLKGIADKGVVKPGQRVAITAGSRGITGIAALLKSVVQFCKGQGARPFLVPAMGSHGGATAEGQVAILHSYGITEEYCGCPILATMETVELGKTPLGHTIYMDRCAAGADAIIAINRIKPHTAFSGPYESGLLKMLTIGLGKQRGAEECHDIGFGYMHELIPDFGLAILERAPVVLGIGIVENAFDETCMIDPLLPEEIPEREKELLKTAKELMGRILLPEADVLIVDEIGKNISGEGADPNVTGLFPTPYASGGLKAQRSVVLRLTKEAHGCAYGMGQFDTMPMKMYEQIDQASGYANSMTSKLLCQCRMPIVFSSDRLAIAAAIKACSGIDQDNPRIIRIKNTAELEYIQISEALTKEALGIPGLSFVTAPEAMHFDRDGNLTL